MIATIQNVDNKLLLLIQRRLRCSVLDKVMPIITSLGTCGVIWGVVMLVFLRMLKYRRIGLILFVTLIFCAVITNAVIKPLVARPRPCHIFTNIRLLISCPMDFSFPSGHTMSSFAAAVIIVHANQALGVIAFILAVLISFSRLYLFVHYPSDVLAGTVFGITIACVMLLIFHH
jgi:undecaprenyl-diphosphatase